MAARDTRLDLYQLIPAFYRIDDAGRGFPLKKLLDLVSDQSNLLKDDIAGLWDDFFIETCADWAIPYIGDLISNRALYEAVRGRRADVAKTIFYRRRKGTLPMLEELARDVTGWGAHAVTFFEQLGWTQNLNHLRMRPALNPRARNPNAVDRVGTAHIRNLDAMDLVDGPFDYTAHTVDVRPIRRTEGWYNIHNIGFFLWRLLSNPSVQSDPRVSAAHSFAYHFSPLGNPAPLFTRPAPELSDTGIAGEIHVPAPIRPLAFHNNREAYYGDAQSFAIYLPDASNRPQPIPSSQIVCLDLSQWERPPAGISGLLSADLSGFPGLAAGAEIDFAMGGGAPIKLPLLAPTGTLDDARASLENAIRSADPSRAFGGTRVLRVGNRLLILPGARGDAMAFSGTAADPASVITLGLNAPVAMNGLLSGDLSEFPTLTTGPIEVRITIAGTSVVAGLGPAPLADLATVITRLEAAITAGPGPTFANAQVLQVENRILILPGVDGDIVTATATLADPTTAEQLRMTSKVGVDVHRGRFAFAIGQEPAAAQVTVQYRYGFSDLLGGGMYDRRQKLAPGASISQEDDTVRFPDAFGARINVPQDKLTLALAVAAWNPVANPRMVIQVNDDHSYSGNVLINIPSGELVIQANNRIRPVILGDITVNAAGGECVLRLDGFWIEGQIHVTGKLGRLEINHCRLVPGIRLNEDGDAVQRDSPSLVVDPSNDHLTVEIDHSILGPLQIPPQAVELRVSDSIIDTARPDGPAHLIPALLSGDLAAFAGTTAAAPEILVTVGDSEPTKISTGAIPNFLAIAPILQPLLVAANPGAPGFTGARVLPIGTRVLILSGDDGAVSAQSTTVDTTTAAELLLDPANSRTIVALESGPLPALITVTNPAPRVDVTIGAGPTAVLNLAAGNKSPAGLAAELAGLLPTCIVTLEGSRILILPPGEDDAVVFTADPQDATTVDELMLSTPRASIAGSVGGEHPAPDATLFRTTIFGATHFRQIVLASEVIFDGRARADRRQSGCVRFSYLTPGSRTPRRFHCQPDLALDQIVDPDMRDLIRLRLRPVFTSLRSGDPGYAQLAISCAFEIKTGAGNGSEMGAFNELMQPQRETNLRIRLEEYLPLGLEPGLIYVT